MREYARDVPSIEADAEALYQRFVNLVANALDAMPRGGRLTVRVRLSVEAPAPQRPAGVIPTGRQGRGRGHRRRDLAVGGRPGLQPVLHDAGRGTGLGLALAHKIVEDHGGTVTFTSAPGHGTTFRIVLPLIPTLLPDTDGDEGDLM